MQLFVYEWAYIPTARVFGFSSFNSGNEDRTSKDEKERYTADDEYLQGVMCGHCLDTSGNYKLLRLRGYLPFCFVEGEAIPQSSVVPVSAVYRRMATSLDMYIRRPFYQVFFSTLSKMKRFALENSSRCYMDNVPQTIMFLSANNLDNVGWVTVPSYCCHVKDVKRFTLSADRFQDNETLFVSLEQQQAKQVGQKLEDKCHSETDIKSGETPYGPPKVMAFDIEVRSSGGMPKAYRINDTIEMISVVLSYSSHGSPSEAQYKGGPSCNDGKICKSKKEIRYSSESLYLQSAASLSLDEGNGKNEQCILIHTSSLLCLEDVTEIVCNDECELITSFFELIKTEDPDVITGYNIYGFDFDYIISRLKLRLMEIPDVSRGIPGSVTVIKVDWNSSAYGSNNYERLVIGGRIVLDMYLYFKRIRLDKYSLEFVSNKFLGEGKVNMSFARMMNIFSTRNVDGMREVARYCIRDSLLVIALFNKVDMWIDVCEIAKITRCSIEDIYTRGEQVKVVAQCVKECMDRQIVLQQKLASDWHDYEGAYVVEPVKGLYKTCALLDFQSLYPSIIIAFNICPSTYTSDPNVSPAAEVYINEKRVHRFRTDKIGLFPGMIKRLLEERKTVKQMMKRCPNDQDGLMRRTVLNRRQNALKICANSVYGIMGFKNSKHFGHVGCAESVTAVGRIYLIKVIQQIETNYELKVVYGDTDSCMIRSDNVMTAEEMIELAKRICSDITSKLPSPMELVFESYYESIMLLSKKRYIMLDDQDNIHYKGVISARRDYCKYAKDMYRDIVGIILRSSTAKLCANSNTKEASQQSEVATLKMLVEYINTKISKLLSGDVDIQDLVITKSVKNLDSYKVNQPHVVMARRLVQNGADIAAGTRLEYVFVKGGNCQGDKMMTPEEVQEGNVDIDARFYIEKQLITQIDDVLDVVGIRSYIANRFLHDH